MITVSNADKALKTYYLDAVTAALDSVSPFYAAIEKNGAEVYGKEVKIAVIKGDNSRVMAGTEDGELPAAGKNRYLSLTAPLKNIYGTIEISDKALRASASAEGAFINLVNAEMEGLVNSAKVNFSRMLYGDGNGLVAQITDTEDGIVVDDACRLFEGMRVDIRSSTAVVEGGEDVTITSVDYANNEITLSKSVTGVLAGKSLYVHGAYGNEITGFAALFGTGDVYGVTRSTESYMQPNRFTVTELTEAVLAEKIGFMEQYFNSRPDMILCSYKTRAKIGELLASSRMQVATEVLAGGYSAIMFDGIPVVADKYCGNDEIYLVNTADFCLAQLCDWAWLEDEDGKILKQVPGKAAYSATLVKYAELVCKKPCGQAKITGFDS